MKSRLLSLFLLVVVVVCFDFRVDALTTTYFNATASCVTDSAIGVCNLFSDPTLWSDPNSLTNPLNYLFSVDLSADDTAIDLNVVGPISIGALTIVGGQQTFLNLNSSVNVTALSVSSVLVQVVQGSSLSATSIQLADTAVIHIGQNSSVNSMAGSAGDTITGDNTTSISLYDQSSLLALTINTQGAVTVADQATLFAQDATLTTLTVGTNATTNFGTLSLAGATATVLSGRVTATNLTVASSLQATFYELGVSHLTLSQGVAITISGASHIRYLYTPDQQVATFSTSITLNNNANLTVGGFTSQNLYTQFTVDAGSNTLTIGNATLFALNTTQSYVKNQPMFTLNLKGFVVLASWFDFNGLVLVDQLATVDIQKHLTPTMCLETYGKVYVHKNITCHQGNMVQGVTGVLNLVDTPLIHLFKFFNNGSIIAHSSAQIRGNLESYGSIEIGSTNNLDIVGYLDLLSPNATLTMDGVVSNADKAALSVLNIITLDGTFRYNISQAPDLASDATYRLLSTQLYFESDFHTVIADPTLEQFNLQYQKSAKAIQLQFTAKNKPSNHIGIIFGILVPLLVITIILTILYLLFKRNKQYRFYTRIQ